MHLLKKFTYFNDRIEFISYSQKRINIHFESDFMFKKLFKCNKLFQNSSSPHPRKESQLFKWVSTDSTSTRATLAPGLCGNV